MMNRTNIFRTLSFVIGLTMLLASTMAFVGISLFPEANNIGLTGSSLVGAYFMFYGITGTIDILKYFKISPVK
ncbi:MAG: hypothetical protein ACI8SC_002540 [Colwellia sp.]|jgi:hypothetical protein